jgi:diacylglycerol kinase (ATP)
MFRAPQNILVIVSPVAGRGRALLARPSVESFLSRHGLRADFHVAQDVNDLRQRAAGAAAAGYSCVAVLGGDGAFHHLVEGALGTDILLGFFPAGSGNDIAEALGIPKDPLTAAQLFLKGSPRPVDILQATFANGPMSWVVGTGGTGLDAEAAQLANSRFRRWPGVTRYLAGALWALRRYKPLEMEVQIETEAGMVRWAGRILLAALANAPCYGSGFRIAPAARIDDGWLDVALVEPLPWPRILEAIPILLRTGDLRWPEIHRYRARRICLKADHPALVHGDGELLGESPVEFSVLPGAVRVIAPQPPVNGANRKL